jgi:hypothetical protein
VAVKPKWYLGTAVCQVNCDGCHTVLMLDRPVYEHSATRDKIAVVVVTNRVPALEALCGLSMGIIEHPSITQ